MPLTFQAIVCAVDFSPFSVQVVRYGAALARRAGVRLYLFHAVHDPQDGLHPTTIFERGGDLTRFTDDAKRRILTLMNHAAVEWEAVVRFGDPVEQTAAFINGLPPCIVVSASHGVSGFRRLLIGTVVERLTRALDRPMLVVKTTDGVDGDRFNGFRSAVVGCDSHGHWQRLAPLLSLIQAGPASGIHLVHSMEGPVDNSMEEFDAASYGKVQQALQERLTCRLREQARRLFPHADPLSVDVGPGVPEEMMLHVALQRASDMIVVGVRRSGKVGRWISGSTTEALLRHSPCCVLTVPEPPEQNKPGGQYP